MKTLEEVKEDYIKHVYELTDHNKKRTAEILGISYRGLRKILKCWRDAGWKDRGKSRELVEREDKSLVWKVMPSNEERIRYRDMMLNADYLQRERVNHCPVRDK